MATSATVSSWSLLSRMVQYTNRHIQHNRNRSMLPIATIATGTLLMYVVLTLTDLVQAQISEMSGTLSIETTAALGRAIIFIAIITMIVGALETAVVMTRSVLCRVQEIGVLKATGVRDRIVFSLFLIEALLYGVIGGVLGVMLGWAIAAIVQILDGGAVGLALLPSLSNSVVAAGLAIGVSLLTAWFPIWRTVRLSAIQALYYQF